MKNVNSIKMYTKLWTADYKNEFIYIYISSVNGPTCLKYQSFLTIVPITAQGNLFSRLYYIFSLFDQKESTNCDKQIWCADRMSPIKLYFHAISNHISVSFHFNLWSSQGIYIHMVCPSPSHTWDRETNLCENSAGWIMIDIMCVYRVYIYEILIEK